MKEKADCQRDSLLGFSIKFLKLTMLLGLGTYQVISGMALLKDYAKETFEYNTRRSDTTKHN